jgi:catechol 2,3-dioxygenase-like lactoylglutathione lyase family enzyme
MVRSSGTTASAGEHSLTSASDHCIHDDSALRHSPYDDRMALALFAEIHVRDFQAAKAWYVRLLGEPSFVAHDTEEVWELAENRSIAVEEQPENAGHGAVTVFVDDLDTVVDGIVARGIEPTKRETYDNGVRKVTFHDPDGNEIGFGGASI